MGLLAYLDSAFGAYLYYDLTYLYYDLTYLASATLGLGGLHVQYPKYTSTGSGLSLTRS